MKYLYFFLFLLLSINQCVSQTLWGISYGGAAIDIPVGITVDSENNLISTGSFFPSIDVDPSENSYTLYSGDGISTFIQKLNQQGEIQWAYSLNSDLSIEPNAIASDSENNIYILGTFEGSVDFNPGPGTSTFISNGNSDVFLMKLDQNGVYQWVNTYGGDLNDIASSLYINETDEIIICGAFHSTIDLDPGSGTEEYTSFGNTDLFIQFLDTDGNYIWNKVLNSTESISSDEIQKWDNGDVILIGKINGTTDFDPGSDEYQINTLENHTGFMLSLSNLGDFNWVNIYESENSLETRDIAISADFNINFVLSMNGGSTDLDPGALVNTFSPQGSATVVQQISNEGQLNWSKEFEPDVDGIFNGLTIDCDNDGSIMVCGQFLGAVDFDPGESSFQIESESIEVFLLNLDQNGEFILAHNMQSAGFTAPDQAFFSENDNLYLMGHFTDSIDVQLDDGQEFIYSNGLTDIFIIKVAYVLNVQDQNWNSPYRIYPNPFKTGINIKTDKESKLNIKIFNTIGALIYEDKFYSSKKYIDLSFSGNGCYFIEINEGFSRHTTKVLKVP